MSFKPLKTAKAITIFGDKILYTGTTAGAKKIAKLHNGKIVDLGGKVVVPGFIDSHMHLDSLGIGLNTLDVTNARSIKEIKEKLRKFADTHSDANWLRGRGWDQEFFAEGRWPNRRDIDEIVANKPVLLIRVCGHIAVVNTKALELLKGLSIPLEPPFYDRDKSGELTGLLREDGVKCVRGLIKYESDELVKFFEDACNHALSYGVTTVAIAGCDSEVLNALQLMLLNHKLPLRIRAFIRPELLPHAKNLGIKQGFGNPYLKISGVKMLADGSFGGRTALLSKPYADDPSTSGVPTITDEELKRIVKEASENKLQVATHAIGDKAIDMVLDAYESCSRYIPELKHRIEHTSIIRPDQVSRIAKLGVVTAVQPHFIIADWWVVKRVGAKRASWVYPFKTLLDAKVQMGFSTDCPVEPINPWETVYASVTRGKYEKIELFRYTKNETLDTATTIHLYTEGSARILHEEDALGTLEEGKFADLVVVDRDPIKTKPKELREIKVLGTIVGGALVYASKELKSTF
jgi:hypothetical protein